MLFSLPFELPTMEIKINNLCNLKCRMCNPLDSTCGRIGSSIVSPIGKESYARMLLGVWMKAPYMQDVRNKLHFWEKLLGKTLPISNVMLNYRMGQMADPSHYKILDLLSKNGKNIEIKYATKDYNLDGYR